MLVRGLIFFVVMHGYAQKLGQSCKEDMIPSFDKTTRTYGYRNLFGEWNVPAAYTKVYPFVGNKAIVMKGTKLGVINCDGYLIIDAIYEDFAVFNVNKVWAKKDGLWGLINEKGGVIIKPSFNDLKKIGPQYDYVWVKKGDLWGIFSEKSLNFVAKPIFKAYTIVSEAVSLVQFNDSLGVIENESGAYLIPPKITNVEKISNKNFAIQINGKWGLLDEGAKQITLIEYDSIALRTPSVVLVKKDGKYGLLNVHGKVILPIIYDKIKDFNEGQAPILLNGKWGSVHQSGKIITSPTYQELRRYKKTLAIAKLDQKFGLIDLLNKTKVPFEYDALYTEYSNNYYSGCKNGKYTFLGSKGEKLNDLAVDSIYYGDSSEYVRVKTPDGIKYYNVNTSSYLFSQSFTAASSFYSGFSIVGSKGYFGVINTKGEKIVDYIYDTIVYEKLAGNIVFMVKKNNKLGLVSNLGKQILETEYELISNCEQRFFRCKKNGIYGIVKNTGESQVPFEYDYISNQIQNPTWPPYPAVFTKGKKSGFINFNGEETFSANGKISYLGEGLYLLNYKTNNQLIKSTGQQLPTDIEEVNAFSEKVAVAKQNSKYGYITSTGNWAIKPTYDEAYIFENKLAIVKMNNKYGVIDRSGKWIIIPEYDNIEMINGIRFLIKGENRFQLLSSGRLKKL